MATLHMDVESVQSARAKMLSEKEAMMAELQALTNQVNQTVGSAWVGNSANEFQQNYESLRSQITQQFEQLEQLAQKLQGEIQQWHDMASRMG